MENIQNPQNTNDQSIGAIRDILFGQNMAYYETQFREVNNNITQNRKEVDDAAQKLNEQLLNALKQTEINLNAQIKKNHDEILEAIKQLNNDKLNRKQLANLLNEVAQKISQ